MTKRQFIALGRKAFEELADSIVGNPEYAKILGEAFSRVKEAKAAHCHNDQEKLWFEIGFLHGTEQKARGFENWNKCYWNDVENAKYEDVPSTCESK